MQTRGCMLWQLNDAKGKISVWLEPMTRLLLYFNQMAPRRHMLRAQMYRNRCKKMVIKPITTIPSTPTGHGNYLRYIIGSLSFLHCAVVKQIPKTDAITLCHACLVSGSRYCGARSNSRHLSSKMRSSRISGNMCSNLHVHKHELEIVYTATPSASGCSASFCKVLLEGITIEGGRCDSGRSKLAVDFLAA